MPLKMRGREDEVAFSGMVHIDSGQAPIEIKRRLSEINRRKALFIVMG
jgi:hypothetical protein